jgi:hypothetical protein
MYCSIENVMLSKRDAIVDVAHGRCRRNVSYDINSKPPSVNDTFHRTLLLKTLRSIRAQ